MDEHVDGDRESVRRAGAEEALRRDEDRPVGSEATPRVTPRAGTGAESRGDSRPGAGAERVLEPGLGTAPTGVPSTSLPPSTTPEGSEPGKAAAFGILGAIVLILGLIALPFFIFSILVAAPIALVVVVIAAVFLAARRRQPYPPSNR